MKKAFTILATSVVAFAILAGMQITAVAATVSNRDVSGVSDARQAQSAASDVSGLTRARNTLSDDEARTEESKLNDTGTSELLAEATPINEALDNENYAPNTGVANVALPGAIALLAAGTIAVMLTGGKKK